MKTKAVASLVAGLFIAPVYAQVELPKPEFYGAIQGQLTWEDGKDHQTQLQEALVGLHGFIPAEHFRMRYKLAAEYSETNPNPEEQDEIIVSEANLLFVSKQFGGLYVGQGTTGSWQDLYSKVDIFDSTNMKRAGGNESLFRQGYYGTNILAYASPSFHNFSFKVAAMSPNETNGADIDVLGLRALYNAKNFSLVLNRAEMDEKQVATGYTRWALASSYKMGNAYLAGLVEYNEKDPLGDSWVYAVSGKYTADKMSYRLGAQTKQWEDDAKNVDKEDETLLLANVSYQFHPNASLYAEVAEYLEDSQNDKINVGLVAHF
ncbi:porin [Enterovibrio coralii]|uniref:Porin domain-containing protein n=1 Tax=Enterovibrio coralii TaxID=294935 RepID=A0A135I9B2_9GAMM|nr:porin [Enterovibrio coralii]KXF82040.1 hypothetical protein ATN88_19690 [Enterovibrio coralii]